MNQTSDPIETTSRYLHRGRLLLHGLSGLLCLLLFTFMQAAQANDSNNVPTRAGEVHSERTLQDDIDAIANAALDGSFKGDEDVIVEAIKDAVQKRDCTFQSLVIKADRQLQQSSTNTFGGDDRDDSTTCGTIKTEQERCHEVNLYLLSDSYGGSLLDSISATFPAKSILQGDVDEIASAASDGSFKGDEGVLERLIEDSAQNRGCTFELLTEKVNHKLQQSSLPYRIDGSNTRNCYFNGKNRTICSHDVALNLYSQPVAGPKTLSDSIQFTYSE